MRKRLRFFFVIAAAFSLNTAIARDTQQPQETFGDKLKKLFVRPTPTPKHHRRKRTTPSPTVTPTPSASETIRPAESVSTAPTVPVEAQRTEPQAAQPQYFEPVRPISPPPRTRRSPTPRINITPRPTASPAPEETQVARPMPSLPPMISSTPAATQKPSASPAPTKAATPKASSAIEQIAESPSYSPEVKRIVDLGLDLTAKNLTYKYVSADPGRGGMDSSGFVHYVLTQSGIKNVPRDAREQYIWVRKAGNFQAVLAQRDDTFELEALKPGDLLFWSSNFGVSRDPDITQTMIYLGRDKTTNQRLMIGASERANYKNTTKSGVGIFDFKVGHAPAKSSKESGPVFVGYGKIPGLAR